MKKILLLLAALFVGFVANAASPAFDGITFTNGSETLDFYSDKVIYHASGASVSRRGDYIVGERTRNAAHGVGEEKRYMTIRIYVGDRVVTLAGEFSYQTSTGKVNWLMLEGKRWRQS